MLFFELMVVALSECRKDARELGWMECTVSSSSLSWDAEKWERSEMVSDTVVSVNIVE
jgi:hypothetical protein